MRGCWKGTGMLVLLGIPAPCVQSLLSLASLSLIPLAFLPTCPHPCIPHLGVPTHGAGCEQGPCGGQGDKAQETEGPCRRAGGAQPCKAMGQDTPAVAGIPRGRARMGPPNPSMLSGAAHEGRGAVGRGRQCRRRGG